MSECPYKEGDFVVYAPSRRGHALDDVELLEIGKTYRVKKIENENYILVEGYKHPGGGIHWTEFQKVEN